MDVSYVFRGGPFKGISIMALLTSCHDRTESGCYVWSGGISEDGYGCLNVSGKFYYAHRLVAKYVKGLSIDGLVVRHICDNRRCVNPEHLKIGSQADNIKDREDRGRSNHLKGSRHPSSKLTEEDVAAIRNDTSFSKMSLARKYNVSKSTIYNVIRHRSYPGIRT